MKKMHGIIAAGHPETAEAGAEMLRLGGNAVDATVAAVCAASVAEPLLTSPGGGGFMLVYSAKRREAELYDFFVDMPGKGRKKWPKLDFFSIGVDFTEKTTQLFHIGRGSIAVPGMIKGLLAIHKKYGTLPLKVIFEPAIHLAQKGIRVNSLEAYIFKILVPIIGSTPGIKSIFYPEGKLLQEGDLLKIPELASLFEFLIKEGSRGFYQGEVGKKIIKEAGQRGGLLTQKDLEEYRVHQRKPLSIPYRGDTILTNPPPSTGGCLIAFALKLLESIPLKKFIPSSVSSLQALMETMRLTNEARDLIDTEMVAPSKMVKSFLSDKQIRFFQKKLHENLSENGERIPEEWRYSSLFGSTTHVSVVDQKGNATSVTTSTGEGAGIVVPGTGIMLNNMLGEADLNHQGFHQHPVGHRLPSMMAPTIVLRSGKPYLILGSGGANRLRTAILQTILNILDFEMPVQKGVQHPRIHFENDLLNAEPGIRRRTLDTLEKRGYRTVRWSDKNFFFGGVHTVMRDPKTGKLSGKGDPRRGGSVIRV